MLCKIRNFDGFVILRNFVNFFGFCLLMEKISKTLKGNTHSNKYACNCCKLVFLLHFWRLNICYRCVCFNCQMTRLYAMQYSGEIFFVVVVYFCCCCNFSLQNTQNETQSLVNQPASQPTPPATRLHTVEVVVK